MSLNIKAFVVDQEVIDSFNNVEELGPALSHAGVRVERIKVVFVVSFPLFSLLHLLKELLVAVKALLLAKPVPGPDTVYLPQVHLHVFLHANLSFLLFVRQLLEIYFCALGFVVTAHLRFLHPQSSKVVAEKF